MYTSHIAEHEINHGGPSTTWLKAKCYAIEECELLGVEGEAGKHAFALMADRETGRYVGSAFINPSRAIGERLWKRVQEHPEPPSERMNRPATQWVNKPGQVGRANTCAAARKIGATLRCRISGG